MDIFFYLLKEQHGHKRKKLNAVIISICKTQEYIIYYFSSKSIMVKDGKLSKILLLPQFPLSITLENLRLGRMLTVIVTWDPSATGISVLPATSS